MKKLLLACLLLLSISCQSKKEVASNDVDQNESKMPEIDIEAELASIEETRSGFQLAIKEGRFADLKNYATSDVRSLTPDCGSWEPYKRLRKNPQGKFHYDSLVMRPRETIIVSDSVAYDFGMSSTYYTNPEGESVELLATFLAVLKKDKNDGRWKLHREVANTRSLD